MRGVRFSRDGPQAPPRSPMDHDQPGSCRPEARMLGFGFQTYRAALKVEGVRRHKGSDVSASVWPYRQLRRENSEKHAAPGSPHLRHLRHLLLRHHNSTNDTYGISGIVESVLFCCSERHKSPSACAPDWVLRALWAAMKISASTADVTFSTRLYNGLTVSIEATTSLHCSTREDLPLRRPVGSRSPLPCRAMNASCTR